jgi:hypothetical protein
VTIGAEDARSFAWLRADTCTLEAMPSRLDVHVSRGGSSGSRKAGVRAGKDVLAVPMPVLSGWLSGQWDRNDATVTLRNDSDAPILLDNIRLEAVDTPPPGALMLDFGPADQTSWPGFQPAGSEDRHIAWSGQRSIYDGGPLLLDPLVGDWVGPIGSDWRAEIQLLTHLEASSSVVTLWLTHYSSRYGQMASRYAVQAAGKVLAKDALQTSDLASRRGALFGIEEDWTPQWVSTSLADRLVQRVSFQQEGNAHALTLANCQIAAVLAAPAKSAREVEQYVTGLEADLQTYRRQFVAYSRMEPVCPVAPSPEERTAGAQVFAPAPQDAFLADYTPREKDRATTVTLSTCPGGRCVVPLAVVPLRRAVFLGGTVAPLRSRHGRGLPVRGDAHVLARAPDVRNGVIRMVPYVLRERGTELREGLVNHLAVTLEIPSRARPGTYRGSIRIRLSGRSIDVPAEVIVHALDAEASGPTVGAYPLTRAWYILTGLRDLVPVKARGEMQLRFRSALVDAGVNAFRLAGPFVYPSDRKLREYPIERAAKGLPSGESVAGPIVDLEHLQRTLGEAEIRQNSTAYYSTIMGAVEVSAHLVSQAGQRISAFVAGPLDDPGKAEELSVFIAQARKAGARVMLDAHVSALKAMDDKPRGVLLSQCPLLLLELDARGAPELIAAFRKAGGSKAYLRAPRPGRYPVGFLAAGVDADGAWVGGVHGSGRSPYGGWLAGQGLVVPETGKVGRYVPTVSALRLQEGIEDYRLVRRCEALARQADQAGLDAGELHAALKTVRDEAARTASLTYDYDRFAYADPSPERMDQLRRELLQASAVISKRLEAR